MRVVPSRWAGGATPLYASPARQCWAASTGLLAAYAGSAAVTAVVVPAGAPATLPPRWPRTDCWPRSSRPTRPTAAAGVALIAWMFDNGFIIGRHASLSWHGTADVRRLAILLAVAAAMLGSRIRAAHRRPVPSAPAVNTVQGIPDLPRSPPSAHCPPPRPVTTASVMSQTPATR